MREPRRSNTCLKEKPSEGSHVTDAQVQKTKNQHTVSRCYLKRFANAQLRFFSFNKIHGRPSPGGTKSATVQEYFYDFHQATLVDPNADVQWAEKTFQMLENRYEEVLAAAVREADAGAISYETGSSLAQFIAFQWMRTVGRRADILEAEQMEMQAMIDKWYAENAPGIPPGTFKRGVGYEAGLHANLMFDEAAVFRIAENFWNLYWIVGRNTTSQPFYTSDDPVVRDRIPPENDGPNVPPWIGIEYSFPLSSKFTLVMMDRYMFSNTASTNGENVERQTFDMGEAEVERYNALQVAKSTQYVFCEANKFALAERLCGEESRISDPARSRELVDATTLVLTERGYSISLPG
jgi:hypothetical protein